MNKSLAYKAAQYSVLRDTCICDGDKLEILRVLMEAEDLAKFNEKIAKETAKSEGVL